MLLRVDIYPHYEGPFETIDQKNNENDDDAVIGDEPLVKSRLDPLYTCLATCSTDDNGRGGKLFVVGRKSGDIILNKDRSVSREHCVVRIVSNKESYQESLKDDNGDIVAGGAARPDRTTDEGKACEESSDGMCVVLENLAKFGTFVVEEGKNKQRNSNNDDDDSATGGDETEEEGVISQQKQAGIALSDVTKQLITSEQDVTLKKLEQNESCVLTSLLNRGDATITRRAIIQCGQNGSTLVITRLPKTRVVFSRLDKKIMALWTKQLFYFGATLFTNEDVMEHSTAMCVVTKEQVPVAKQLLAWCHQVPIVNLDYLQEMLNRNSPADPLPNPEEFRPSGGRDPRSFWKQTPNPKLWKDLTMFTLNDSNEELEDLVQAAGGAVVHLQDEKMSDVDGVIKQTMAKSATFTLSIRGRNKLADKLKAQSVPVVSQKAIPKCLCEQKPLEDNKGNAIVFNAKNSAASQSNITSFFSSSQSSSTSSSKKKAATKSRTNDTPPPSEGKEKTKTVISSKKSQSSSQKSKKKKSQTSKESDDEEDKEDKDGENEKDDEEKEEKDHPNDVTMEDAAADVSMEAADVSMSSQKAQKIKDKAKQMMSDVDNFLSSQRTRKNKDDERPEDKQNLSKITETESIEQEQEPEEQQRKEEDQPGLNEMEEDDKEEQEEDLKKSQKEQQSKKEEQSNKEDEDEDNTNKTKNIKNKTGKKRQLEEEEEEEEEGNNNRHVEDGWILVAPKNDKVRQVMKQKSIRHAERQRQQDDSDDEGSSLEIHVVATTEVCPDLIVARVRAPAEKVAPVPVITNGKDFKRFRKNMIVAASPGRRRRRFIELQAVLPKETERQRELIAARRAFEEQRKMTDELFHGGGDRGASGRRGGVGASASQKRRRVRR